VEEKGLLDSIVIGQRKIKVSMLQFFAGTLFFSKANLQCVLAVKATLMCFELAFGLKVNYSKSKVGGEGNSSDQFSRFASILNCDGMKAHFTYLSMKVGDNHKRLGFWEVVLKKIGELERKFFVNGTKSMLIKFVLTSIPLFYISCFYMYVSVTKEL